MHGLPPGKPFGGGITACLEEEENEEHPSFQEPEGRTFFTTNVDSITRHVMEDAFTYALW